MTKVRLVIAALLASRHVKEMLWLNYSKFCDSQSSVLYGFLFSNLWQSSAFELILQNNNKFQQRHVIVIDL